VAEWSKALAWKVSMGQKLIQGSNPCRSASWPVSRQSIQSKNWKNLGFSPTLCCISFAFADEDGKTFDLIWSRARTSNGN
jgi:hypothetical protein